MYFVYILKSLKGSSYYVGFSTDPERRLKEHNRGIVGSTKSKQPYVKVWSCVFEDKMRALAFEKYLKSGSGIAFYRKRLI